MRKIILGLLCLISLSSYTQSGEKNFIDQNYIEVSGRAELEIIPDLIYLKIILADKENKEKKPLEEIEKIMYSKLSEAGIDLTKDLSVKDMSSYNQSNWFSKNVILSKEFSLIVHDAKTLQKVFKEFQKLEISNVSIEKVDHSKIVEFRKQVKINAIKAAKEKAESLTQAIGQNIGKAIFIQESNIPIYFNQYQFKAKMRQENSFSSVGNESSIPEINFEKINLQYEILARFELK